MHPARPRHVPGLRRASAEVVAHDPGPAQWRVGGIVAEVEPGAFRFIRSIVLPLMSIATKRDWRGREHIPAEGAVIMAPNHTSYFDPLVIGHFIHASGRVPRFLGKREIVEMPVLGRLFKAAGQIPVHRGTASAANAYRDAITALGRGACITIYPEGTTTKDPDLWPMMGKTGAARMALATGAPVIPIAQWGAHEVMRKGPGPKFSLLPRKTMHVHAGAPVALDDLRDRDITSELLEEATERIMLAITMLLAEIRAELPPAERFDPRRRRGESA